MVSKPHHFQSWKEIHFPLLPILRTALDMKLHFTSGYHPEGDGQTKQLIRLWNSTYKSIATTNKTIGLSELLPLAEFTYNNTPSATAGITPFFSNKGYHLNLTVHPEHDLASARARDFVTDLDELHQELWQHIAEAQHRYQAPLIPDDFQLQN